MDLSYLWQYADESPTTAEPWGGDHTHSYKEEELNSASMLQLQRIYTPFAIIGGNLWPAVNNPYAWPETDLW